MDSKKYWFPILEKMGMNPYARVLAKGLFLEDVKYVKLPDGLELNF